jgi:hypothetical protein
MPASANRASDRRRRVSVSEREEHRDAGIERDLFSMPASANSAFLCQSVRSTEEFFFFLLCLFASFRASVRRRRVSVSLLSLSERALLASVHSRQRDQFREVFISSSIGLGLAEFVVLHTTRVDQHVLYSAINWFTYTSSRVQ